MILNSLNFEFIAIKMQLISNSSSLPIYKNGQFLVTHFLKNTKFALKFIHTEGGKEQKVLLLM